MSHQTNPIKTQHQNLHKHHIETAYKGEFKVGADANLPGFSVVALNLAGSGGGGGGIVLEEANSAGAEEDTPGRDDEEEDEEESEVDAD